MATVGSAAASTPSWSLLKNSSKRKMKNERKRGLNVTCSSSSSAFTDPYKTLRINPGASESEIRKAFRQLALQYHPDVCIGSKCGVQFHHINEAYDMLMSNLRNETKIKDEEEKEKGKEKYNRDEPMWGMNDSEWDHWEEWMGWEGAGIRDYSSHINP